MNTRKTNKIQYVILLAFGISLFVSGCKSGVERKKWFRYASKYDQALSKMSASGGALEDFYKVRKMMQKFLLAKQPTEAEVISVLRSPNRRFQKVGLAAMCLKPIETDQLIDILFEFLQDQDPEFRWYATISLEKFTKFPESKKADYGGKLLEIVKTKKDNGLFIEEFLLLAKFPSEEAALLLAKQMLKEGGEEERKCVFRYAAFRALKEMGDSYYDEAAEYVNTHGSPEIKNELLEREKSWESINTSTGKE